VAAVATEARPSIENRGHDPSRALHPRRVRDDFHRLVDVEQRVARRVVGRSDLLEVAMKDLRKSGTEIGLATLCVLALFALVAGSRGGGPVVKKIYSDVRNRFPNKVQEDQAVVNYYQQLNRSHFVDPGIPDWMKRVALWLPRAKRVDPEAPTEGADDMYFLRTAAIERDQPYVGYRLKPNVEVRNMGVTVKTNRWQMRDDDYSLEKPPGTFRIAILGASNTMGIGVEHEHIFEHLLEQRLNKELAGRGAYQKYEVLNFAVLGYFLDKRLYVLENFVAPFKPDLVIVTTNMHDVRRLYMELAEVTDGEHDLHFDFLKHIVQRAGIEPGDSIYVRRRKLEPYKTALVDGCFSRFKAFGEREGVPVAIAVMRLKADQHIRDELMLLVDRAQKHDLPALRIFEAYEGQDPARMYLADIKDSHPTKYAHQRLADDFWKQLVGQPPPFRRLLEGEK
jgi:hypothetical protein